MGDIYGRATIVISAIVSEDGFSGFLATERPSRIQEPAPSTLDVPKRISVSLANVLSTTEPGSGNNGYWLHDFLALLKIM